MKEQTENIIIGIVVGIIITLLFTGLSNDYTDGQRELLNEEGEWIENCR